MKYIDPPDNKKINEKDIKIISIARFNKQKDHETLVKALTSLKSFNWHLTLVGTGPLENDIKLLIKKYGIESKVTLMD